MLDLCGMHHLSRVVFSELFLSSTLLSKIGKPETKQKHLQVQYENETT